MLKTKGCLLPSFPFKLPPPLPLTWIKEFLFERGVGSFFSDPYLGLFSVDGLGQKMEAVIETLFAFHSASIMPHLKQCQLHSFSFFALFLVWRLPNLAAQIREHLLYARLYMGHFQNCTHSLASCMLQSESVNTTMASQNGLP